MRHLLTAFYFKLHRDLKIFQVFECGLTFLIYMESVAREGIRVKAYGDLQCFVELMMQRSKENMIALTFFSSDCCVNAFLLSLKF